MHPQAGRRQDSQNIGNCAGSAAEVGRPSASDTVKSQCCNLELYPLRHWQPMEDIAKDWFDVLIFSKTNNETSDGVEYHLQSANDHCVAVVNSDSDKCIDR